jgi:hypothetical protein
MFLRATVQAVFASGARKSTESHPERANPAMRIALWFATAVVLVSAEPAVLASSGAETVPLDIALASVISTSDELIIDGERVTIGVEDDPQTVTATFEATAG